MPIKRYKGQPLPIIVSFEGDPLEVYNKTYSDITDVSMNIKKDLASDADDAYLEKTLGGGGVTIDEPNNRFIMAMAQTDYTNLNVGDKYYVTLNLTVSGFSEMIETDIPDRVIEIVSDTNRN